MTHYMKLAPQPFAKVKSGTKTIEMRLNDEKRREVRTADKIIFTQTVTGERINAEVTALYPFEDFESLYEMFPPEALGYGKEETPSPEDMKKYYTEEQRRKYGVLGIGIKIKNEL